LGFTESRDVDSHVSGTPQAGSRDQSIPLQLYTVALAQRPFSVTDIFGGCVLQSS